MYAEYLKRLREQQRLRVQDGEREINQSWLAAPLASLYLVKYVFLALS